MNIVQVNPLTLIAVCVALAAYVSNVRRDMAKRCRELREDINDNIPIKLLESDKKGIQEKLNNIMEAKKGQLLKKESEIRQLKWADGLLVFASLAVLAHWAMQFSCPGSTLALKFAVGLFSLAVVYLAYLHYKEWKR